MNHVNYYDPKSIPFAQLLRLRDDALRTALLTKPMMAPDIRHFETMHNLDAMLGALISRDYRIRPPAKAGQEAIALKSLRGSMVLDSKAKPDSIVAGARYVIRDCIYIPADLDEGHNIGTWVIRLVGHCHPLQRWAVGDFKILRYIKVENTPTGRVRQR